MGQKFAAYDDTGAISGFYDSVDSPLPDALTAIEITDAEWQTCIATHGYSIVSGVLTAPPAPTEEELARQASVAAARAAFAAGLSVVSSSTPAINGTYSINQLSQMDIIAIETSLNAGKGFPGGASTFNYPDVTGSMHGFSQATFTDFAAAVRDYVYLLNSVNGGASTTLPAPSTTIA